MRRITTFMSALLASAMLLASCSSNDNGSYPKHITGGWLYADTQTTYIGMLDIEDIAGGQYAQFAIADASSGKSWTQEGTFIYDGNTGKGYIQSSVVGGTTVSVQTFKDSENLKVLLTSMEGTESTVLEFVFRSISEENIVPFTTGKWNGSTVSGGVTTEETLEVTSLVSDFGTFTVKTGEQTTVYDITDLSIFVKIDVKNAIGYMELPTGSDTDNAVLVYDTVTHDVTVYFNGTSVKLSPSTPE